MLGDLISGPLLPCALATLLLWPLGALGMGPGPMQGPRDEPDRLRVISWNVYHGFDHGRSLDAAASWLRKEVPGVVALQELNGVTGDSLESAARAWGHHHSVLQKETGFALGLTSAQPIEVIERAVEGFHHGYLHARTQGIDFFVVHFWPGKEHELGVVLGKARALAADGAEVAIVGDFNSHSAGDADFLSDKALEPRYESVLALEEAGFVDVVRRFERWEPFSFPSPLTIPRWSKDVAELEAKRQRIDFVFAGERLGRRVRRAGVRRSRALGQISDHYPVVADFALGSASEEGAQPALILGVMADCQYCTGPSEGQRLYQRSRQKLEACVEHWNLLELDAAFHLGDLIDRGIASFDVVTPIFGRLRAPGYHVLGNHDYSVADEHKPHVPAKLGLKSGYYDLEMGGWRFVVLDGNDISFHAHAAGSKGRREAERYYAKHAAGAPRWNGAIGAEQLAWLRGVLQAATEMGERAIVLCHFPVFPANKHNLWNAAEVLAVLRDFPCVQAYLSGHNHAGGYGRSGGIHFLTLRGMVDTAATAYAVLEIREERIDVLGYGRETERTLLLR